MPKPREWHARRTRKGSRRQSNMEAPGNPFQWLDDTELTRSIGKLSRLVRSLKREPTAVNLSAAHSYQQALTLAETERQRRSLAKCQTSGLESPQTEQDEETPQP